MGIQEIIFNKIVDTFEDECSDLNPIMKMVKDCEDRGENLQERGFLSNGLIMPVKGKVWVGIGYNKIDYPEDIQLVINNGGLIYSYVEANWVKFKDLESKGINLQTMKKDKTSLLMLSAISVSVGLTTVKFNTYNAERVEVLPKELYGKEALRIISSEHCYFDLLCLDYFSNRGTYEIEDIKAILKGVINKIEYNKVIIAENKESNRPIFILKKTIES